MPADEKAPVTSTAEIDVGAPPQVVWGVLTRFENWPNWNPEVKSMSFGGPLAPGSEFRWKAGPGTIVSTIDRLEPPRYISWRGRTLMIKAYHEWWLEPRDGVTHVKTEEAFFFGLVARLLRGTLQKTFDKALADGLEHLRREAERRSAKP